MRSLTLAGELARGGVDVHFMVNEDAPSFVPSLKRAGFPFTTVGTLREAAEIAARQDCVEAIVCDSYEFHAGIERSLRTNEAKIVVIDDLANRLHDCDLLIDSTFGRSTEEYSELVPAGAIILTGAHYALVRPEFGELRGESFARRAAGGGVERILVSLGLTDVGGITARIVAALMKTELNAQIEVVIGRTAQSWDALEGFAAKDSRIELHVDPPDMAHLMAKADIAIGAGGTTSWERCCLGLPTVLVVLAENQRLIANKLGIIGAVKPVQGVAEDSLIEIVRNVTELSKDVDARSKMTSAAGSITDGRGAGRATEGIYALMKHNMRGTMRA